MGAGGVGGKVWYAATKAHCNAIQFKVFLRVLRFEIWVSSETCGFYWHQKIEISA